MKLFFTPHITTQEQERTKKLLQQAKTKFGIDAYIFTKKILLISLIIHHYQKTTNKECWVDYEQILKTYETKLINSTTKASYCRMGVLFFGFCTNDILPLNIIQIQNVVIKRCETQLEKLI